MHTSAIVAFVLQKRCKHGPLAPLCIDVCDLGLNSELNFELENEHSRDLSFEFTFELDF